MLAFIAEVFSHGTPGIRCNILQGCRITGTGGYDGGVFHGPVFFQHGVDLGHRRLFLPASHINTENIRIFLGQNGINGNSGFTDLPIADDQFPLSASHRCHGINSLEPRIAGLMNTLAVDNTRGDHFNPANFLGFDGTLSIQGFADGRNDPTKNTFTHRNLGDLAGAFHHIAFFNMDIFAHDGATHIVLFKIQYQAQDPTRELDQLQGHDLLKAVNARDTVTNRQNHTGFAQLNFFVVIRNLFFNNLTDFFCS